MSPSINTTNSDKSSLHLASFGRRRLGGGSADGTQLVSLSKPFRSPFFYVALAIDIRGIETWKTIIRSIIKRLRESAVRIRKTIKPPLRTALPHQKTCRASNIPINLQKIVICRHWTHQSPSAA